MSGRDVVCISCGKNGGDQHTVGLLADVDIARSTFDDAITRVVQRSSSLQGLAQRVASSKIARLPIVKWPRKSKGARWRRSAVVSMFVEWWNVCVFC